MVCIEKDVKWHSEHGFNIHSYIVGLETILYTL